MSKYPGISAIDGSIYEKNPPNPPKNDTKGFSIVFGTFMMVLEFTEKPFVSIFLGFNVYLIRLLRHLKITKRLGVTLFLNLRFRKKLQVTVEKSVFPA